MATLIKVEFGAEIRGTDFPCEKKISIIFHDFLENPPKCVKVAKNFKIIKVQKSAKINVLRKSAPFLIKTVGFKNVFGKGAKITHFS